MQKSQVLFPPSKFSRQGSKRCPKSTLGFCWLKITLAGSPSGRRKEPAPTHLSPASQPHPLPPSLGMKRACY